MPETFPQNLPTIDLIHIFLDEPTMLLHPKIMDKVKEEFKRDPESEEMTLVSWLYTTILEPSDERYETFKEYRDRNLRNKKPKSLIFEIDRCIGTAKGEVRTYRHMSVLSNQMQQEPDPFGYIILRTPGKTLADEVLRRSLMKYANEIARDKKDNEKWVIEYFDHPDGRPALFMSAVGLHFQDKKEEILNS